MFDKVTKLEQILAEYQEEGLILALSGGVDSAVLLAAATKHLSRFLAITFDSILYPKEEISTAKELCAKYGVEHLVISPEIQIPDSIRENPKNRCYLCKKNLFFKVLELAQERGYHHIIDGTNADDLGTYRPGMQALKELGIKSPLADCGFTKKEVRAYAAEVGLSIAEKPSGSCYATRLPYGATLSPSLLGKLAEIEEWIRGFGIRQIRLRYHEPILRLEIFPEDFALFLSRREEALAMASRMGFPYLTLDVAGFRSGSMDVLAPKTEI